MSDLILASASPRRKELLENIGLRFRIVVADIEEKIPDEATPEQAVEALALQKAQAVADMNKNSVVIGADTVVVLDGKILGKPKSEDDAIDMLSSLSGRTHTVCTGVAIINGDEAKSFVEVTEVEFHTLTADEIVAYVKTGEPMDKAGAYGIQGKGCVLVKRINGDYFNVVGLPVSKVYKELGDYIVV